MSEPEWTNSVREIVNEYETSLLLKYEIDFSQHIDLECYKPVFDQFKSILNNRIHQFKLYYLQRLCVEWRSEYSLWVYGEKPLVEHVRERLVINDLEIFKKQVPNWSIMSLDSKVRTLSTIALHIFK